MTASRVYIGRLSHRARDRDVEKLFKSFGRIREIVLKNGYGFVEFEEYRDADDAVYELNGTELAGERIIVEHAKASGGGGRDSRDRGYSSRDRDYDRGYDRGYGGGGGGGFGGGRGFRGRGRGGRDGAPVWLDKYGPPTRTDYRVKIDNLSSRTSWQDLKDYMRQAGEVTYADAHRPYKGEGVVEFATYSDMKAAVDKLDDTELGGKRIRVEEESKGGSRRRSSSRSRSRTRSRSRSRSRSRRTRSRSRSAKRSRSRSKSKSKTRSRSRSRSARRSASPPPKSRSKSKSAPKRSRSRSGSRGSRGSRSRSRSK